MVISFRCWGLGVCGCRGKRQHIAEGESAGLIHAAIEAGVNYFDTAPPYHRGESEGFLGRALAQEGYRDRVKVATKLPHWATPEKRAMHAALDKQLRELQTDRIDYYLIHNLSGTTWARAKQHGVMEFLDEAQAAGKIINPASLFMVRLKISMILSTIMRGFSVRFSTTIWIRVIRRGRRAYATRTPRIWR